jgi:acid stress-induced BolA-like protein IbaG/YrbA
LPPPRHVLFSMAINETRVRTMTSDEIETLIRSGLPEATVQVIDQVGDGNHFQAVVVTAAFAGKSLVERHQLVYGSLQGAMAERIHALSIKAYTPDEWGRAR